MRAITTGKKNRRGFNYDPKTRKFASVRTNGEHRVDAASTLAVPISYGMERILRPQSKFKWLMPNIAAITPAFIEQTLTGALAGNHVQQWALFDLMLKSWPELLACYTELVDGVLRKDLIFEAYTEEDEKPTPEALDRMKVVSTALHRMAPDPTREDTDLEGTVKDILDAIFRGLSVSEIVWQTVDDPHIGTFTGPKCTYASDPTNFAFSDSGVLGLILDKPGARAPLAWPYASTSIVPKQEKLAPFPKNKFLISMHKASSGSVMAGGLLRPLAWWWCAANFSSDWLLNLAQVFGLPFRWANYAAATPQETIDAICNMLQNMGSAGWAAFPEGTTLEMIHAGQNGSDHSPQGELLDRADRYARVLILGQTMTGTAGTTGKGGGQAFGTVEADVKSDRIDAAGRFAEGIINRQLIPFILRMNYGNDFEAPVAKFLQDEQAGTDEAERDTKLIDMGLEVGVDYMRKKYDIPAPAEGEETLKKEEPPPPVLPGGKPPMPGQPAQPKPSEEASAEAGDTGDFSSKLARLNAIQDDALFARALAELAAQELAAGDLPGHEFRGNQYVEGIQGDTVDEEAKKKQNEQRKAEIEQRAKHMADRMDFDQDKIKFNDGEPPEFNVGDRKFTRGGMFDPETGTITLDRKNLTNLDSVDAITAHEISHAQFDIVRKAQEAEHDLLSKLPGSELDRLFTVGGFPRKEALPELNERFPVSYALGKTGWGDSYLSPEKSTVSSYQKMIKEDGVSDYSRAYWAKGAVDKNFGLSRAVDETLAEIGSHAYTGAKHIDSPSEKWREFGRVVRAQYSRIRKKKGQ